MNNKIIITLGNPNGIGPEITSKALLYLPSNLINNIILIGDSLSFKHYFQQKIFENIEFIKIDIKDKSYFKPGQQNIESGKLSYLFLKKAVTLIKNKNYKLLVTAPISKELIVKAGYKNFKDHTTFLASKFKVKNYNMMFYSEDLKVILATIHIPLKKVPIEIKKYNILKNTIDNAIKFLDNYYKNNQKLIKIAICGLNPHAGENGVIGNEEELFINPVINQYKHLNNIKIIGPLPSDSLFYKAINEKYDMIVALYHDQGLIPFKLLHFNDGVNVTLGLPFIRTSPDHGTAFDIAGKNIADPKSMINAINLAIKLGENLV